MDIDEFIALSNNKKATDADIAAFEARIKKREKQFAEEAKRMKPDTEWLNRRYDI